MKNRDKLKHEGHIKLIMEYKNGYKEFIIPLDWFKKTYLSDEKNLEEFLNEYTSEDSSEIYCNAILAQKLEGEVYYE